MFDDCIRTYHRILTNFNIFSTKTLLLNRGNLNGFFKLKSDNPHLLKDKFVSKHWLIQINIVTIIFSTEKSCNFFCYTKSIGLCGKIFTVESKNVKSIGRIMILYYNNYIFFKRMF